MRAPHDRVTPAELEQELTRLRRAIALVADRLGRPVINHTTKQQLIELLEPSAEHLVSVNASDYRDRE